MAKAKTVEGRALEIAAEIMQAAGLCRHDSVDKCRRLYPSDNSCARCIKTWLLAKARKELQHPAGKTNADHIRSMGDEELANLLYSRLNVDAEQIPFCKGSAECETLLAQEDGVPDSMCLACMLKWLQEPWKKGAV